MSQSNETTTTTVRLGYTIAYVSDVAAALRFYETAFGLTRRMLTPEGDYGELDTGPTVLAFVRLDLASANLEAAGGFVPLDPAGRPPGVSVTLITDDVRGAVDAAVSAGARSYTEPIDKPWGQTVAYVVDPSGLLLELATEVAG